MTVNIVYYLYNMCNIKVTKTHAQFTNQWIYFYQPLDRIMQTGF